MIVAPPPSSPNQPTAAVLSQGFPPTQGSGGPLGFNPLLILPPEIQNYIRLFVRNRLNQLGINVNNNSQPPVGTGQLPLQNGQPPRVNIQSPNVQLPNDGIEIEY